MGRHVPYPDDRICSLAFVVLQKDPKVDSPRREFPRTISQTHKARLTCIGSCCSKKIFPQWNQDLGIDVTHTVLKRKRICSFERRINKYNLSSLDLHHPVICFSLELMLIALFEKKTTVVLQKTATETNLGPFVFPLLSQTWSFRFLESSCWGSVVFVLHEDDLWFLNQ